MVDVNKDELAHINLFNIEDWYLWESQEKVFHNLLNKTDNDGELFLGGYRSGKSVNGARSCIYESMRVEKSSVLVMGIDKSKAKDSTWSVLMDELPGENTNYYDGGTPENSPIVREYKAVDKKIIFINDSTIKLGGAGSWNDYAGTEYNLIWMDEVAHYKSNLEKIMTMIGTRLSSDRGLNKFIITTTGNGENQFYRLFIEEEYTNGEEFKFNYDIVRANTLNNPFLPDKVKERLKRQHSNTNREEQALKGGFKKAKDLAIPEFTEVDNVVTDMNINKDKCSVLYGVDFGFKDYDVVLKAYYNKEENIYYIVDEYYRNKEYTEKLINFIKENDKGKVYADPSEPEIIDKMNNKHNLNVNKADNDRENGLETLQKHFNNEFNGKTQIFISNECINLIDELNNYTNSNFDNDTGDDHAIDSLRYLIHTHSDNNQYFEPIVDIKNEL